MRELLEFSGPTGYLVLMLGMFGVLPGLGALGLAGLTRGFRPALLLAGVTLGLGVGALLMGFIGRTASLKGSYRAVAHASPVDRSTILAAARSEAEASATLGLGAGIPLLLLAGCAMGAAFARTGEA